MRGTAFFYLIHHVTSFAGKALVEVGEAFNRLSEIKDSLDVGVKQDFLDPLQQLCDKDIKEVMVNFFVS